MAVSPEMLKGYNIDEISEGAIVVAAAVISADVAIYDYDDVIGIFKYVRETTQHEYKAHMATLIDHEDSDELDHPVGERCIVLESEDIGLESLILLDYNYDGLIKKVTVTHESRYRFQIDAPAYEAEIIDNEEEQKKFTYDFLRIIRIIR